MDRVERLRPEECAVVVVDVQERLAAAMEEDSLARLVRACTLLLEAAGRLGALALYTEQYPKGLGTTLPDVAHGLRSLRADRFEKTVFSAWHAEGFAAALGRAGPRTVIVVGMESHVCVYQSVRDLAAHGYAVHVPVDGVASRRRDHWEVGLGLCERAGAIRTTAETIVFDWLEGAGTDAFKALSQKIR